MGGDLSGLASAAQIVAGVVTDVEVAPANIDGAVGVPSMRTLGVGAQQAAAGNDARFTDARTPTAHAASHEPLGSDAMAVDAVAAVGSLRTIGTGALQATAGNDARLSDARSPVAHATRHEPGGIDAMAVDAAAGVGSLRTIGTGALQATAGNDSRLSDARSPTAHATRHEPGGIDAMAVDAAAGVGSLRTIGTGALQATAGNDARLSDARSPTAHATRHEPGGIDAMAVDAAAATASLRTIGTGALQAASGTDPRLSERIGEPYCTDRGLIVSGNSVVLNHIRGMLYRWPKSGTVASLAVFCTATGGNLVLGIYDQSATNLNQLATGPSQASGANNTWHSADMTTPLPVVAGQDAYLVLHTDNTSAAYGRTGALANNLSQGPLPAGYITGADGLRMRSWDFNRGSFSAPLPNTISVASIVVGTPIVVYVKYA